LRETRRVNQPAGGVKPLWRPPLHCGPLSPPNPARLHP
jgi:hypothetical protein